MSPTYGSEENYRPVRPFRVRPAITRRSCSTSSVIWNGVHFARQRSQRRRMGRCVQARRGALPRQGLEHLFPG